MVTMKRYLEVMSDRPEKLSADDVEYGPAPEGSAMRCSACLHYFRRAIDGFTTCELFRNRETDANGVRPDFRCGFYTLDGQVFPLQEDIGTENDEVPLDLDDIPF